jgi:hypothetical protein
MACILPALRGVQVIFGAANRSGMDRRRRTKVPFLRAIACPRCDALFSLAEEDGLRVDACGLERCALTCTACGGTAAGIIDPFDGALVLS